MKGIPIMSCPLPSTPRPRIHSPRHVSTVRSKYGLLGHQPPITPSTLMTKVSIMLTTITPVINRILSPQEMTNLSKSGIIRQKHVFRRWKVIPLTGNERVFLPHNNLLPGGAGVDEPN